MNKILKVIDNILNKIRSSMKQDSPKILDVDFEMLLGIYEYLSVETNSNTLELTFQENLEEFSVARYSLPSSYLSIPLNGVALNKYKLHNYYDVFNLLCEKMQTGTIDVEKSIDQEYEYDFLELSFNGKDIENKNSGLIKETFWIFFIINDGSDDLDNFRVLYNRCSPSQNAIKTLLDSEYIEDLNNPSNHKIAPIDKLEKVIAATAKHIGLTIPSNLVRKYNYDILPIVNASQVTKDDFVKIINLVNYLDFDNDIQEVASRLNDLFHGDWEEMGEEMELEDEEYLSPVFGFPLRYECISEDNVWYSDWKFDADDVEFFISQWLGEDWVFEYPEDTYSDDLFPYIQQKLAEQGLELMNIETFGDSYMFFLANKKDVSEIIALSKSLSLEIKKLDY